LLKLISVKFLIDENWLLCGKEVPKPELDSFSDDGLINRYKTIIKLFDTLIPRMDEYSLEYFEQSIEFSASILFNTDLNNINNSLYLKNIYSILNELEQIIYLVSKDTLKKVNVKNIVSYKKLLIIEYL